MIVRSAGPAVVPVWLAGGAAAAFVSLTVAVAGRAGPLLRFDVGVSRAAHNVALAYPLWREVMSAVTATGSATVLGPLTAVGCAVLLAYGHRRQAVFAAVAMTVTLSARLVVLHAVARPRPLGRLTAAAGYSFPSGHSTASAAAALTLVLVCLPLLRRRCSRVVLCLGAVGWAFAVGLSRVALVVHWPTDVVGAWLFVLVMVSAVGLLLTRLPGGDSPGLAATAADQLDGDGEHRDRDEAAGRIVDQVAHHPQQRVRVPGDPYRRPRVVRTRDEGCSRLRRSGKRCCSSASPCRWWRGPNATSSSRSAAIWRTAFPQVNRYDEELKSTALGPRASRHTSGTQVVLINGHAMRAARA